jgi:hypothetical protein
MRAFAQEPDPTYSSNIASCLAQLEVPASFGRKRLRDAVDEIAGAA